MQNPLSTMKVRALSPRNTFGMVRTTHGKPRPHQGWDLAAPVGTPVYAITSGLVRDVRDAGDYGIQISLEFQRDKQMMYAFYAHLSRVVCAEGQNVCEGSLLGFTGRTGNAKHTAPHLHFEIRKGRLHPGTGLHGRIDPGEVLGYSVYSSQ